MNARAPCIAAPLVDPFGRAITYVRVSVTDRCDFRCVYCMSEDMNFLPKRDVLSLEELDRLCSAFVRLGTRKLRITGGEPLVRRDIMTLFRSLSRHLDSGALDELTLTTNGSQLARYAGELARLRRRRVNVSLDTLDPGEIPRDHPLGRPRQGDARASTPPTAAGLEGQDQRRRAEGLQRRRGARTDRMGAWARLRPDLHRGDAARRRSRRSASTNICR